MESGRLQRSRDAGDVLRRNVDSLLGQWRKRRADEIDGLAAKGWPLGAAEAYCLLSGCRDALGVVASRLAPFLVGALLSPRQLLLDFGVYRTAAGAEAQEWHTDSPFKDGRIAHVQISLVPTDVAQGELPTTNISSYRSRRLQASRLTSMFQRSKPVRVEGRAWQ